MHPIKNVYRYYTKSLIYLWGRKMKKGLFSLSVYLMISIVTFEYAFAQFVSTDIIKGIEGSIHYATGGISVEERIAMNTMNENYNVRLIFALASGHYLADIQVDIQNAHGERVLLVESNGPLFLVNLPEGSYTITATHRNNTIEKKVNATTDFHTVMFHWGNLQL